MRRFVGVVALVAALGSLPARAVDPFIYEVCAHVPITGAAPIPYHQDRFGQYYFDYVNEELGGVDGHPVRFSAIDDQYFPAGARGAVEQCHRDGAHLYVGYHGPDQMLSVARWAEDKQVPYLHGPLSRAATADLTWSAQLAPTAEEQMKGLAEVFLDDGSSPSPVFATVLIDSPYFEAGAAAFADAITDAGYERPLEYRVQKDERQFQNIYYEMQTADVTHVNLYVTPNIAMLMFAQRPTTFDPLFGSIEPTVSSGQVAAVARDVRFIAFHDPGPVYDPTDQSLPWYDEMQEFQRIFYTYSPETDPPPDDNDWNIYLRAKQIHRLLDALDEDLSPEHVRAAFSSHTEAGAAAFPSCALDFAVDPRYGQHAWHVFRLEAGTWEQAATCVTVDGIDLTPPVIDCGDSPRVVQRRLRCTMRDGGSGVGPFRITAEGLTGDPIVVEGGAQGCEPVRARRVGLPRGAWQVSVTARNCAGAETDASLLVVSARA